jgi:hypothetical protein
MAATRHQLQTTSQGTAGSAPNQLTFI